jgi:DNA-binding transcriptional MerR regulator
MTVNRAGLLAAFSCNRRFAAIPLGGRQPEGWTAVTTPSSTLFRIGEVAARAGVSTRTIRYYEELGLLDPAKTPGGSRRYSEEDVTLLERVLELRDVMGFELERIAPIVRAECRLDQLRDEYQQGVSEERHAELVREAAAINDQLCTLVAEKIEVLHAFAQDLEARADRLRTLVAGLEA